MHKGFQLNPNLNSVVWRLEHQIQLPDRPKADRYVTSAQWRSWYVTSDRLLPVDGSQQQNIHLAPFICTHRLCVAPAAKSRSWRGLRGHNWIHWCMCKCS